MLLPFERLLTNQINLSPAALGLMRAAVHCTVGLASAIALLIFPWVWVLVVLAIITVVFLSFDIVRLRVTGVNTWFVKWFALFLRDEEETRLTGASYFLLGCLLTALVFPCEIASLAIFFAALGDPAASIVGNWKGRTRFWAKSVEGSIACLIVCLVVGISVGAITKEPALIVAVAGAFLATVFELLPLRVNDNITIPIGSAAVMMIIGTMI